MLSPEQKSNPRVQRERLLVVPALLMLGAEFLKSCSREVTSPSSTPVDTPQPQSVDQMRQSNLEAFGEPSLELIDAGRYERMMDFLTSVPSPFLNNIGNQISALWSASEKPATLPDWIGEGTVPWVIAKNQKTDSRILVFAETDSTKQFRLSFPENSGYEDMYYLSNVRFGEAISSSQSAQQPDAIDAFNAATIWMLFASILPAKRHIVEAMTSVGYTFTYPTSGKELTAQDLDKAAIQATLFSYIAPNSGRYLTGLPQTLITFEREKLLAQKAIKPEIYEPHTTAGQILMKSEFDKTREVLTDVTNDWAQAQSLEAPDYWLGIAFHEDVRRYIDTVNSKLPKEKQYG